VGERILLLFPKEGGALSFAGQESRGKKEGTRIRKGKGGKDGLGKSQEREEKTVSGYPRIVANPMYSLRKSGTLSAVGGNSWGGKKKKTATIGKGKKRGGSVDVNSTLNHASVSGYQKNERENNTYYVRNPGSKEKRIAIENKKLFRRRGERAKRARSQQARSR